jgi:hypothetical protein
MKIEVVRMACTYAITAAKAPTAKAPSFWRGYRPRKAGICCFE